MSDWDERDDPAWIAEQHKKVVDYLARQSLEHGGVRDTPDWHIAPIVAVWSIESLAAPGRTGWWAISGDLPTDYESSRRCHDARAAVRRFAENWLSAAGDPREDGTLGTTGLPADLRDLLAARAKFLAELCEDDEIWRLDESEQP